MIKIYKNTIKEPELKEIDDLQVGSWVNVINPTVEDIKTLSDNFKITKVGLEDSLDEHELPRIEKENSALFIYTRIPVETNGKISTTPLTIILTESFLITISLKENKIIQRFLEEKGEFFTTQKAKFLLKIFSETVWHYNYLIKKISSAVYRQKIKIRNLKNQDIITLVETEETLNDFISALVPNINVYQRILSGKYFKLYENDQDLIEDVLIDSKQVLDLCQTNTKKIHNIREAYSTIMTNNLNKVMKFLAAITVILTIPTIIASVYGMNVGLPWQNNPLAFIYIIIFALIISLIMVALFAWRKWL